MNIACINIYNDFDFLKECLKSLKNFDRIIVVDGAYKDFPHKYPWSTDGSITLAKLYNAEVITTKKAWNNEIEKRNQYLLGKNGDYYLVIDADEVLIGDFNPKKDDHDIEIVRDGIGKFPLYRVFKHRAGIHYAECHNALFLNDRLLNKEKRDCLKDCRLIHRIDERPQERREKKGIYYRKLAEFEKEFREKNGI